METETQTEAAQETVAFNGRKVQAENMRLKKQIIAMQSELDALKKFLGGVK